MKRYPTIAALLLGSITFCAWAGDDGLMVSFKIERNGVTISTPRIWSQYGKDASIQIAESFRLELNAHDLGATADLKMNFYTSENGSFKLASSPRIHASFATESVIQMTGTDGAVYRITLAPARVARPV